MISTRIDHEDQSFFPGLSNSQKIRIIVDGVGIYTNIKNTVTIFATTKHREAVEHCLNYLSTNRVQRKLGVKPAPKYTGYCTRINNVNVQVDIL